MNANCVKCSARCCRYFCVPLGMPAGDEDLDTARWYLLHEGASVFIDQEGTWWVRAENRCRMLEDGPRGPRCRNYHQAQGHYLNKHNKFGMYLLLIRGQYQRTFHFLLVLTILHGRWHLHYPLK